MKRFIALCALSVAPFTLKADAQMADARSESKGADKTMAMMDKATSASNETWSDRTQVYGAFTNTKRPLWAAKSIQPILQTEGSMANTWFAQGEFGFRKWESPEATIGTGYRHLAADGNYMYGANIFYDHEWKHSHNNVGMGVELFGRFFTMRLNYNFRVHDHKGEMKTITHYFREHHTAGNIDINFQLPFLPWTMASFGPVWHHDHENGRGAKHDWKYALLMNIAGPVSVEGGFGKGWGSGGYVKLAVNFGRPAVMEHCLTDAGIFSTEAFTARDLKNYTLETVGRFGWIR